MTKKILSGVLALGLGLFGCGGEAPKSGAIEKVSDAGYKCEKVLEAKVNVSPTRGLGPLEVNFMGLIYGCEPLESKWDFGDGTVSEEINTSHVYSMVGSYPATLTVKDANKKEISKSVEIIVDECVSGRNERRICAPYSEQGKVCEDGLWSNWSDCKEYDYCQPKWSDNSYDPGSFPAEFVTNDVFNGYFVVGIGDTAEISLAVSDLATSLSDEGYVVQTTAYKLDSEVNLKEANTVLLGNPCNNSLEAEYACNYLVERCADGLEGRMSVIGVKEWDNGNKSLSITGLTANEVRLGAKALSDPNLRKLLKGAGTVKVYQMGNSIVIEK